MPPGSVNHMAMNRKANNIDMTPDSALGNSQAMKQDTLINLGGFAAKWEPVQKEHGETGKWPQEWPVTVPQ